MTQPLLFNISIGGSNEPPMSIRKKGTSLLQFPSDFTVVDLETTGLNARWDSIIEVSCIKFRNGKEISRFCTLVNPEQDFDPFITQLTGITYKMLKTAPTFDQIAQKLWDFLQEELIVGHNVNFDINFLYDSFFESINKEFSNDYVDSMRLARRILPSLKHHTLEFLSEHFKINCNHHRATDDCITTVAVMNKLQSYVVKQNINIEDLFRNKYKKQDITKLQISTSEQNGDSLFFNKNVVFTGKLDKFSRVEAAQLIVNIGGCCQNSITSTTNFLIMGDCNYTDSIKNGKTNKIKKAEQLQLQGKDIKILTESTFYDLLSECTFKENN